MAQRIVFLMSDTGGGHRASAQAIGEALSRLHGASVQWQLVDLLVNYGVWPLSQAPRLYEPLLKHRAVAWRALWWASAQRFFWLAANAAMRRLHRRRLFRFFDEHPADLYVSVHPLLNHAPQQILQATQPGIRFATVVTDLMTAPPSWYNPKVDLLCASCAATQQAALAAGLPASRVRLLGLPIRRQFEDLPAGAPCLGRQKLGLPDQPLVLVMAGGAGMGPVAEIVQALAHTLVGPAAQLAVICGRNEELRSRLAAQPWPLPVSVLGFVDDVAGWMTAADCLVTKAGPGVIAEALACGLPMLLSGYIPGQETGNVAFVVENGVGAFSQQPAEIATIVRDWLAPGNPALTAMQQKARELARHRAALEIAQALGDLL